MDVEALVSLVLTVLIPLYVTSFLLYAVRVVKGPTIPDRVLAIDSLGYDLAAFMVVLSILVRSPLMVVSGLTLALWIYALDIYIAKYLEAREMGG
ncbi:MAG: monovalent cation/H+ antiporter complex subunit F [Sulfolobales archaeon]|nr:monovalent cation/H+ antiporter complex subunit F [Sulfolobales archaeon]MCX8209191.1 monovalent cation/H+ antiporter complex subunit F [Sulfolobales archaeon]MDW8010051.1 monovalent cation/H+ antiporter complex subunit F [Sulfolobales archaeon]